MTASAYVGAAAMVHDLTRGAVSAVELTDAAIARIGAMDGVVNAICVADFDRARDVAREADRALARGGRQPLLGVPVTVKESFHVAGLPTTWGDPAAADFVPREDAEAVRRLRAAGAIVLGKTNVPLVLGDLQTSNLLYGTTRNPWDLGRTPGGSSGGSAAALASGYTPLSLGSDLAGSLRGPAHCCGVFAHKPTLGLLPRRGHTPPRQPTVAESHDLAVVGPMACTAADLVTSLHVLAGPEEFTAGAAYRLELPPPRKDRIGDYRVLVLDDHPLVPCSADVRAVIDRFATELAETGCTVLRDSPVLPDQAAAARLFMRLLYAGLPPEGDEQARADAARTPEDDDSLAAERARGAVLSHRDWLAADRERAMHRQRWGELFAEIDVVIAPILPTTALPHDRDPPRTRRLSVDGREYPYGDQTALAGMATLPGLPATALPLSLAADGLPVGVQIIGPLSGDLTTIRVAELVEREFGRFGPPTL